MFDGLTSDEYCPVCGTVQPVEMPPCPDGHGPDCMDRICTNCATALYVGSAPEGVGALSDEVTKDPHAGRVA